MDQDIAREAALAAEAAARKAALQLQEQQLQEEKRKQAQEEEEEQRRLETLRLEESQKVVDMNEEIDIWSDNFFGPTSM